MSDPGHQTITPYFTVESPDRFMNFMVSAFGAEVVKLDRYDDGTVQHARLMIGDALIMLNQSTDTYPANVSQMHLRVGNADATYETAVGLGATSLMTPNDRPHGERMAGIEDPSGNVWWIASPLT